jgi:FMN reductase
VTTAVLVGNPRPGSRTLAAALEVASRLQDDPPQVVDLATLGTAVLDAEDVGVQALVDQVSSADLLVVASPTYKGSYTGLLKAFLDRVPHRGLEGRVAVPVMLGAGPGHALAAEVFLRPVLAELGAVVPASLFLLESSYDDPAAYDAWAARTRPLVDRLVRTKTEVA